MIIPTTIPNQSLFKSKEVAALFSVTDRVVRGWIKFKKIDVERYGLTRLSIRIPHENILKFIDNEKNGKVNKSKVIIQLKIFANMRGMISRLIRGKSSQALKILGCSADEFMDYLERQFKGDMTWENYGRDGWTIDHIIPCARFDFKNPEHYKICFHYTNLQPMWHIDNIKKGKKITNETIAQYLSNIHSIS